MRGGVENKRALSWFEAFPEFRPMIGGVARSIPIMTLNRAPPGEMAENSKSSIERLKNDADEFEQFGKKILSWYGVLNPVVSKRSGDGGIDFIGEGGIG